MKHIIRGIFVFLLLWSTHSIARPGQFMPRFIVEIESGPVWQSRNDQQIPNNENGTRFSLPDLVGKGPYLSARLYLTWNINNRHGLRMLLAPLIYTGHGVFQSPVDFSGETFGPGLRTEATYKFNSYRLTYRYRFLNRIRWAGWIGFTAKIRDAKVQLEQGGISSKKTDVGFVPLLHLGLDYRMAGRWRFIIDLDALAGGPGRAEDLSVKLLFEASKHLCLTGGYRTVEGGADVDEVYSFAWIHYMVLSVVYRF